MEISPIEYGLSSRVKLRQISEKHIGIVKQVKSRIIQKDAYKIIEIAEAIRNKYPQLRISLICYNNICSKSVKLLNEHIIEILYTDQSVISV